MTALRELAELTGCGVRIDASRVPILPETEKLADHFGIDPFGLIASGCLIATLPRDRAKSAIRRLRAEARIPAGVIGELTGDGRCVWVNPEGKEELLPVFERDELARLTELGRDP